MTDRINPIKIKLTNILALNEPIPSPKLIANLLVRIKLFCNKKKKLNTTNK